jgi:hypothetical protein
VKQRQNRVAVGHARACIAHDGADALAHGRFVAVNSAVAAGRLVRAKPSLSEPFMGVLQQFRALCAQFATGLVLPSAVDADHHLHSLGFPGKPATIPGWSRPFKGCHRICTPPVSATGFALTRRVRACGTGPRRSAT